MKFPRWLSPVRTVEAETGWPRPLCETVARVATRGFDLRLLLGSFASMTLVIIVPMAIMVLALKLEPPMLTRKHSMIERAWDTLFVILLPAAAGLPFFALLFAGLASKTRRFLRRYLPEPWCFKCRYPTPGTATVCPECGEPIPPEIAGLVAQRGP
jgi:hypothetical protein